MRSVSGQADRDLLIPDQPNNPGNRRVSITLIRQAPPDAAVRPAAPRPAARSEAPGAGGRNDPAAPGQRVEASGADARTGATAR